jgi:carboxyl-terminal processing protease
MDFKRNVENTDEIKNEETSKKKGKNSRLVLLVILAFVVTNLVSMYAGSFVALELGQKVVVSKQDSQQLADVKKIIAANGELSKAFESYSGVLKFKKLFEVNEALHKLYFGDINDDMLVEGAIKGMTAAINDPYTVFMNAKEYTDFNTQTEGTYVGLGLQVGVKNEKITVIAPFEGSPAYKAGIITGDIIEKVNGKDVTGKDLELAVSMMKGKENEEVTVTIFRENKGQIDFKMKRAVINLVTVKGEMLENNIGYIQLTMFDEHTGKDFEAKLKELKGKGMKGLVLDLRSNPGGLLTTCVDVVSHFVAKDKVLVSTKDKYNNEKKYNSEGGIAIGMPLVVLIDEGTASASEIVSGVVRDYKLGTIIGTNSFGKGVVQTLIDTKDGTALKVTISKYFTPNGENIHKVGIKPDIEVEYPLDLRDKPYTRTVDPQFNKALEVIKEKVK